VTGPTLHLCDASLRLSSRATLLVDELTLAPGITAVLGNNGSGKSTLLRVLATVRSLDRGTYTVAGVDATTAAGAHALRSMLGYLPQHDSVPPRMTSFDHVDMVAAARHVGGIATRARRAAVGRGLPQIRPRRLVGGRSSHLSGGQRRRVAIAAALVGSARILVLDEPDSGLDAEQRARLRAVLAARSSTTTIVIATHDVGWATTIADRLVTVAECRVASVA
jgi:ABC-2 type transport system ATP-binding protein